MKITATALALALAATAAPFSMLAQADSGSAAPAKPEKPTPPAKSDPARDKVGVKRFKAKCKKEGLTKAQCKEKWKELHGDKAEALPEEDAAASE